MSGLRTLAPPRLGTLVLCFTAVLVACTDGGGSDGEQPRPPHTCEGYSVRIELDGSEEAEVLNSVETAFDLECHRGWGLPDCVPLGASCGFDDHAAAAAAQADITNHLASIANAADAGRVPDGGAFTPDAGVPPAVWVMDCYCRDYY